MVTAVATIYKICTRSEWHAAGHDGVYRGSDLDRRDGFIHFSTAAQLEETLRRYYANAGDIVIAAVNAASLGETLKYEYSSSRGEDFPHLYGPLRLIYKPKEQATVLSELFTQYAAFFKNDSISNWLRELKAAPS